MVDLKPIKKAVQDSGWLLRRWLVLGTLVVAVGALALWGGLSQKQAQPQGASGMLMEQLQAHIGADAEGETVLAPVSGGEVSNPEGVSGTEGSAAIAKEDGAGDSAPNNNEQNAAVNNSDNNSGKTSSNAVNEAPNDNAQSERSGADMAEDEEEVYDYAPDPWLADAALSAEAKLMKMLAPVKVGVCSRGFGYNYDPTFKDYRFHGGLDFEAAAGTTVICPLGAEVAEIQDDGFGGRVIVLEHGDKLVSRMAGIEPVDSLKAGDKLSAGDKLGEIGEPPLVEDAQPPHLHWELLLAGEPVDAAAYGYGE